MKDRHLTTFTELGLDPLLLKALETEGYTTPTPIQSQAIPSVLDGKDLLGIAQTGTGKTAAFALPILQRLAANRRPATHKGVRALVLSPTRELATQIAESFKTYGRHMGFTVSVVFGGVAHKPQRDALHRGVDILVATPGRLLDHMSERNVTLEFDRNPGSRRGRPDDGSGLHPPASPDRVEAAFAPAEPVFLGDDAP